MTNNYTSSRCTVSSGFQFVCENIRSCKLNSFTVFGSWNVLGTKCLRKPISYYSLPVLSTLFEKKTKKNRVQTFPLFCLSHEEEWKHQTWNHGSLQYWCWFTTKTLRENDGDELCESRWEIKTCLGGHALAQLARYEIDEEASSHMMTVIPVVQDLREQQYGNSKQHNRCQAAFPSLSQTFKQTPSIWVASISATDCISFVLLFALLSWHYAQLPTVRVGFLNSLDSVRVSEAEMEAAATVQPQARSFTSYYVKLSLWVCECAKYCGRPPVAASYFCVVSCGWHWLIVSSLQSSLGFKHFPSVLSLSEASDQNVEKNSFFIKVWRLCCFHSESVNEPPVWLPSVFSQNSFRAPQLFPTLR